MGFWSRRITNVAALMGGSGAQALLAAETDGLSIDFTDASLIVRDTTTTSNAWTAANGDVQDFWRSRSFTSYSSPSPKITRDSDGYYKYRPHNLYAVSENMRASGFWQASNTTVTAYGSADPFGTTNAVTLTEDFNTSGHRIRAASTTVTASIPYTVSAYLKAGTRNYAFIGVLGTTNHWFTAVFDLTGGSAASQTGTGATSGTIISTSQTSVGDGWYRCTLTGHTTQTNAQIMIGSATLASGNTIDTTGQVSYVGDSTSTIHVVGAQLNAGPTALTYVPTRAHNLVIQSQVLGTSWTATDVTVGTNAVAAPDGTTTADSLTEGVAGTALLRSTAFTVPASATVTASIYLKTSTATWVRVRLSGPTDTNGIDAWFNSSTGALGSRANIGSGVGSAHTITAVGNSWYRVTVTGVCSTDTSLTLSLSSASADASATRVNSVVYYGWQGQGELGTSAGKAVSTTTAAVYSANYDLPREWDSSGACQGLLVEEARTNLLTYSTQFDNAAWTKTNILSTTADATTSPSGQTDADLVIPTTGSSTHLVRQGPTTAGAVQSWSVFAKPSGYTKIGIREDFAVGNYAAFLLSGAGSVIDKTGGTTASIEALANGWYRLVWTGSSVAANQGLGVYIMASGYASGDPAAYSYAGDGTSGVYLWQADQQPGAFITSPIYTGSASVTRAVDSPLSAGTVAPSGSAWTIFAKGVQIAAGAANTTIFSLNQDGLNDDHISLAWRLASVTPMGEVADDDVQQAATMTPAGSVGLGSQFKSAVSAATNDFITCTNGTLSAADTSGTVPAEMNRISFGVAVSGSWNGAPSMYLRQVMILPRAMSDAELQTVTT
jgi:hypothetical protein